MPSGFRNRLAWPSNSSSSAKRPGRHDVGRDRRDGLDSAPMDLDGWGEMPGGFGEEGAFPGVGIDEMDLRNAHDRQHQPGEAGAAAEIDQGSGAGGDQGKRAAESSICRRQIPAGCRRPPG